MGINWTGKVQYPETLVEIWKFMHGDTWDDNPVCGEMYQALLDAIIQASITIPGISNQEERSDAARDFLAYLFQGGCPSHIGSRSILIREMKKYLALNRSPVLHELDQILREALRSLEKEKQILRDDKSIGKRISQFTYFALPNTPYSKTASFEDYEKNAQDIPIYHTKLRGGNIEDSKILPLSSARELVMRLIQAFGGWVRMSDLSRAMRKHVPELLQIVPISGGDPNSEIQKDPVENLTKENDDSFIYEFEEEQMRTMAYEAGKRIWKKISAISIETFCLYTLPKGLFNRKYPMKSIGKTSTVSDQDKKCFRVLQNEFLVLQKEEFDDNRTEKLQNAFFNKIINFLSGQCSEKGYFKGLY